MKNQKGITLIALVITIIVLLILAGVAIAMLTGDNSVLTRAQSTKAYNAIGAAKDEVATAYNAAYAEYLRQQYDDAIAKSDKTTLAAAFKAEMADVDATEEGTKGKSHGCKIQTSNDGKVDIELTLDGIKYSTSGAIDYTVKTPSVKESTAFFEWEPISIGS